MASKEMTKPQGAVATVVPSETREAFPLTNPHANRSCQSEGIEQPEVERRTINASSKEYYYGKYGTKSWAEYSSTPYVVSSRTWHGGAEDGICDHECESRYGTEHKDSDHVGTGEEIRSRNHREDESAGYVYD